MRRKKEKQIFRYECTMTGETFTRTRKVDNTGDLISVKAYYEMNPALDDRPEGTRKQIEVEEQEKAAREAFLRSMAPEALEAGPEK